MQPAACVPWASVLVSPSMHVVLFDIDGTLVDSNGFDAQLYVAALGEVLGIEVDQDWTRYRHVTDSGVLEEVMDEIGCEGNRDSMRVAVERDFIRRVTAYLDEKSVREIPGAVRFVETLEAAPGVAVGFATGGWRDTALMKLRKIGLQPDASRLASSSDARSRTDIMSLGEQRVSHGACVSRRTYFGDAPWDKHASELLGFDFIAIGDRVDHHPRFADYRVAKDILEVMGVVEPEA